MNNPSLREVQQWMKAHICPTAHTPSCDASDMVNPQRGPQKSRSDFGDSVPDMLRMSRGTPGVERLAVYAGGYVARTREALAQMYEAVRHVVGERVFAELARRYAVRHPSHDYNVNLRGRHLPEFLATDSLTDPLPFLPDLARLERFVSQAFHAFEVPPGNLTRLGELSLEAWSAMRIIFQPSVGVIASAWPIVDIWEARTRPRAEVDIDLVNRPQRALVFRDGLTVRCELLEERPYALLEALLAGRTLGEACETLAQASHGQPLPLAEWFARWRARGLIARCARESVARTNGV